MHKIVFPTGYGFVPENWQKQWQSHSSRSMIYLLVDMQDLVQLKYYNSFVMFYRNLLMQLWRQVSNLVIVLLQFISIQKFIEPSSPTEFPTSRLEMNAVADMFDHGGRFDQRVSYYKRLAIFYLRGG